ncbi:radical SAM protein [Candidatus Gracilibacteria bacterium]|nr:radical SAM protein [Candidatus Gracilibacteria bacterium]NUJ98862.1 radical SAM protein [Candidatus Gracilibacteria bacterium]
MKEYGTDTLIIIKLNKIMNNIRSYLIRLNIACNEKCSFCNVTQETEPNFKEKSIFEILFLVKQIIKREGKKDIKISLSGGEPLLRKDIELIVLGIKKLGVNSIEMQTNASLLFNDRAEKLIKNGINKFFISFHSHKQEIFENYVGLKGIFPKVVSNIKNLGKYKNIEVILNPVISKKNYKELKDYFDFVKEEFPFVKYISLSFIQPHGKAKKNINLMLDYETINKDLFGILDYVYNLGFVVNNPYCGLPICIMGWDKYNVNCIEVIENKMLIDSGIIKKDNNKIYIKECEKCIYKGLCNGIWKEYKELYGSKGINCINSY